MIDEMKLRTKIALIVIAALVGLGSLTVVSAFKMKQDLINGRKDIIRSVVEGAYSVVSAFQAKEAAGTMTREQAEKAAAEALNMFRYGGKDGKAEYIFAVTVEGVGIAHGVKERIGKNMLETIRDPKGN